MRPGLFILPFLSLFLAGLAAIVSSGMPEYKWLPYVSWGVALLPILLWIVLDRENFARFFRRRGSRYGASSGVTVLLGILVIVGAGFLLSRPRFNKSWDVTRTSFNTLSDQTEKAMARVKEAEGKVQVIAFFQDQQVEQRFRDEFDLYQKLAPDLKVEYVNPIQDPVRAQAENLTSGNTVIVRRGDQEARITAFDEEKITNAFVEVLKEGSKKIYFLKGHGEGDMTSQDAEGYGLVTEELRNNRYEVEALNLLEKGGVPDDADMVILAGPKYDLRPEETTFLENYLKRGGAMLSMVGAIVTVPNLNDFLAKFGLNYQDDLLILRPDDPRAAWIGNSALVTEFDASHPITRTYSNQSQVTLVMGNAPQVTMNAENQHKMKTELIAHASPIVIEITGVKSEADLRNLAQDRIKEGKFAVVGSASGKLEGSKVASAASGEDEAKKADVEADAQGDAAPDKETRLVAIGSSQFATNLGAARAENRGLFVNTINYLLQDEDFISIRPRSADKSTLDVTTTPAQLSLAVLAYLYPFVFLGFGAVHWLRRRSA